MTKGWALNGTPVNNIIELTKGFAGPKRLYRRVMDNLFTIDLQIFAEGGAGGAAAAGADAGSTGVTAAPDMQPNQADNRPIAGDTNPKPRNRNPLADVQYGIQPTQPEPMQQEQTPTEPQRVSFDELIAGDYKADYEAKIQATIQDRLKGTKAREDKTAPILKALADQYGVDVNDLDSISEAMTNDVWRYEQTALQNGADPETVERLSRIKTMEQERIRKEDAARKEAETRQHYKGLQQQAEEMKQLFPGFDLDRELSDPEFFKLTSPDVGLSLKGAYYAKHGEEIMGAGFQYAAEKSQAKVAASVQANNARPREGGLRRATATEVKADPTKLTKMDRAEIKRRVGQGEKIFW